MKRFAIFLRVIIFNLICLAHSNFIWAAPQTMPQVTIKKALATTVDDELSYPARVESSVQAIIGSDIDGVVLEIPRALGEKIKAGATLMRLQHTDPGFTYSPYKVTAPISGVVSLFKVTVGSRVTRGEALALITDPTRVRLIVEFTPTDLPKLKIGQRGILTVRDEKYDVEISGMSPMIDPATGTAQGELKLIPSVSKTKPTDSLPGGLAGVVHFKLNQRQAILLPDDSLVYRTDETFVRVLTKDKKAERKIIKLGAHHDSLVEVISGLSVGDSYISRSSRYVKDGETVEVQPESKNE